MVGSDFKDVTEVAKHKGNLELKALLEAGRNNRGQLARNDKWNEKVIQGYDWAEGAPMYTKGDAEKMRNLKRGVTRTTRAASQMGAIMDRYSQSKVLPDDVKATMQALSAEMTLAVKDTEAFGALQSSEFDFLKKVVADPTSLQSFLFDPIHGTGNKIKVQKMIELARAKEADMANEMGLVPAGSMGVSAPMGEVPALPIEAAVQEPVVAPNLQQNTFDAVLTGAKGALRKGAETVFGSPQPKATKKASPPPGQSVVSDSSGMTVMVGPDDEELEVDADEARVLLRSKQWRRK
jgi:hypothetical protein